jgi:hypothetical protein
MIQFAALPGVLFWELLTQGFASLHPSLSYAAALRLRTCRNQFAALLPRNASISELNAEGVSRFGRCPD